MFIIPICMPYWIRSSIKILISFQFAFFSLPTSIIVHFTKPLVITLDFSSTLDYATHIPVTRNSVQNCTWPMALSIVAWCSCFKSDNWQAILRRNLVRSSLHQKASCTTYSPASESTNHHGISKLFSRASTTCYTATWKDGGYNFKCPDKNWFASVIFVAHVTRGPKWTVTFFSDSLCNVLFVQWTFDLIDWHLKLINVYSHNLCSFSTQATFFNIDIGARLYCK